MAREVSCHSCGISLAAWSPEERQTHSEVCLQAQSLESRSSAYPCPSCGLDLTKLSDSRRIHHMQICMPSGPSSKAKPVVRRRVKKAKAKPQISPTLMLPSMDSGPAHCPLCLFECPPERKRGKELLVATHIVQCGVERRVEQRALEAIVMALGGETAQLVPRIKRLWAKQATCTPAMYVAQLRCEREPVDVPLSPLSPSSLGDQTSTLWDLATKNIELTSGSALVADFVQSFTRSKREPWEPVSSSHMHSSPPNSRPQTLAADCQRLSHNTTRVSRPAYRSPATESCHTPLTQLLCAMERMPQPQSAAHHPNPTPVSDQEAQASSCDQTSQSQSHCIDCAREQAQRSIDAINAELARKLQKIGQGGPAACAMHQQGHPTASPDHLHPPNPPSPIFLRHS